MKPERQTIVRITATGSPSLNFPVISPESAVLNHSPTLLCFMFVYPFICCWKIANYRTQNEAKRLSPFISQPLKQPLRPLHLCRGSCGNCSFLRRPAYQSWKKKKNKKETRGKKRERGTDSLSSTVVPRFPRDILQRTPQHVTTIISDHRSARAHSKFPTFPTAISNCSRFIAFARVFFFFFFLNFSSGKVQSMHLMMLFLRERRTKSLCAIVTVKNASIWWETIAERKMSRGNGSIQSHTFPVKGIRLYARLVFVDAIKKNHC